jgi:thrombospondin type 3 repeat protein
MRRFPPMRRTTTAILALVSTLGLSATLLATMDDQKAFLAKYPDAKAKLGKCSTCHVKPMPKKGDEELNAYGKDLKATGKTIDFAAVEAKDSDGDGVKNGDEIKAGTNPGDPASK